MAQPRQPRTTIDPALRQLWFELESRARTSGHYPPAPILARQILAIRYNAFAHKIMDICERGYAVSEGQRGRLITIWKEETL